MNRRCAFLAATAVLASGAASAGTLSAFTSDAKGFDTHTYYYEDGKEVTLIEKMRKMRDIFQLLVS